MVNTVLTKKNTMESLTVTWEKCGNDNHWCDLLKLDLESIKVKTGIYIIWHHGTNPRWVRVGQGDIKARLSAHRNDKDVLKYENLGLSVTWADVPSTKLDGVEAYLGNQCDPLVGERFPDRTPIQVNLPKS